jgi:hypothetical protein
MGAGADVEVVAGAAVAVGSADSNGVAVSPPACRLQPTSRSAMHASVSAFMQWPELWSLSTASILEVLFVLLSIYRPRTKE